jgi:hypothetical protein
MAIRPNCPRYAAIGALEWPASLALSERGSAVGRHKRVDLFAVASRPRSMMVPPKITDEVSGTIVAGSVADRYARLVPEVRWSRV